MSLTSSSDPTAHLKALKKKHLAISERLEKAQGRPSTADYYLTQLKKQKLLLKDRIEHLAAHAANESLSEERA